MLNSVLEFFSPSRFEIDFNLILFLTPSIISCGFLFHHLFDVYFNFSDATSSIEDSIDSIKFTFKTNYQYLINYNLFDLNREYDNLLINNDFFQLIKNWVCLNSDNNYDHFLKNMRESRFKNRHLFYLDRISKCNNVEEFERLQPTVEVLSIIIKNIGK